MLTSLLLAALISVPVLAQAQPPLAQPPLAQPAVSPPMMSTAPVLDNGACLDSARPVPRVLQSPVVRTMQVVRIDKVISTSTMTNGEVIGFLYTLEDGSTWLGQRNSKYMSAAQADEINQVLASTHAMGTDATAFPPQMRYGVATKLEQFFKVQIPASAWSALRIRIDPCVEWPSGRPLPDPSM